MADARVHRRSSGLGLRARQTRLQALQGRVQARLDAEVARLVPNVPTIKRLRRLRVRAKTDLACIDGVLRVLARPGRAESA